MKNLAAAIALLCLSSSVLAHDIYTDLHDRDGNLCCGRQDCMPVEATVLPDGSYFLPKTRTYLKIARRSRSAINVG